MSDTDTTDVLDAIRRRSAKRRDVLKYAGQATAVASGLALLAACGDDTVDHTIPPVPPIPTPTPTPGPTPTPAPAPTGTPGLPAADIETMNFLLNLAYLQAAFYVDLGFGTPLDGADISGTGTLGTITITAKAIALSAADTTSFAQTFAQEIGRASLARLRKIRSVLGSAAIATPAIDVTGTVWKPLGTAAYANAGATGLANYTPNSGGPPYIAATGFINSVVLSAFRGAASLVTSQAAIDLIAGCIVGLSYHTAQQRTLADIQSQLAKAPNVGAANGQIVSARAYSAYADTFDGADRREQGLYIGDGVGANGGGNSAAAANVVVADADGLALARTPQQVLNVLFLTNTAATSGGFFAAGVNGTITTSGSNA